MTITRYVAMTARNAPVWAFDTLHEAAAYADANRLKYPGINVVRHEVTTTETVVYRPRQQENAA